MNEVRQVAAATDKSAHTLRSHHFGDNCDPPHFAHRWIDGMWHCLGCGQRSPDPCNCVCWHPHDRVAQ